MKNHSCGIRQHRMNQFLKEYRSAKERCFKTSKKDTFLDSDQVRDGPTGAPRWVCLPSGLALRLPLHYPSAWGPFCSRNSPRGQQGNTQLPPPLLCLVDAHLQSPFRFVFYGTEKSPGSGENGDLHTGLQDAEGELRGPGFCILLENTFRKQKQGQKRIEPPHVH